MKGNKDDHMADALRYASMQPKRKQRQWHFYAEWSGFFGLGFLYVPKEHDFQVALGPWTVGVEWS